MSVSHTAGDDCPKTPKYRIEDVGGAQASETSDGVEREGLYTKLNDESYIARGCILNSLLFCVEKSITAQELRSEIANTSEL